jgi:4,5-dihydroxyphthalate decarboxylase
MHSCAPLEPDIRPVPKVLAAKTKTESVAMALTVTLACGTYDRVRALHDGSVGIAAATVVPVAIESEDLFPRVVSRADFDITEMSLSSYLVEVSRGAGAYTAIPVFLSRGFRHSGIYVRADAGITAPKDLEGRPVGIPEYQMTFGLWVRGILHDQYGVDTDALRYRTAGTNRAGRVERLPLELPPSMDVQPLGIERTLNEALLAGDIDAILSPSPPLAFTAGDPNVARLFPDAQREERAYFERYGFFPIMHVVGIRKELVAQHPGLAAATFAAFTEAKRRAYVKLDHMMRSAVSYIGMPWIENAWADVLALMGPDFWSYGVPANREQLEAICRYSTEQHLARHPLRIEDLFVPSTLSLTEAGA